MCIHAESQYCCTTSRWLCVCGAGGACRLRAGAHDYEKRRRRRNFKLQLMMTMHHASWQAAFGLPGKALGRPINGERASRRR